MIPESNVATILVFILNSPSMPNGVGVVNN
jgi:hypothetical protein